MKYQVLNNYIGPQYSVSNPSLSKSEQDQFIASLFEQLLVFDTVTITTNRLNYTLWLLIHKLGINTVERLLKYKCLKIMLWTPVIVTSSGRKLPDGTLDRSAVYDRPPLATGSLSDEDLDPERNINSALSHFDLHRDRRRIFSRIALPQYIVPNGMKFAGDAGKLIINAYESNNLSELGLPYDKDPYKLDLEERSFLQDLGYNVLETALVSEYNLKSYGDAKIPSIYKQNLNNIGNAYKVSGNTTSLLNIEGVPSLKDLYLQERIQFDRIFEIRYLSSAKYYRKWINEISDNQNAKEISVEYLNEIKGTNKFFESNGGKLLRNIGVFGMGMGLGAALGGPVGAAIGAVGSKAAEFGLGLLDTFVLDGLLKGKNPSMFIDTIKSEVDTK